MIAFNQTVSGAGRISYVCPSAETPVSNEKPAPFFILSCHGKDEP